MIRRLALVGLLVVLALCAQAETVTVSNLLRLGPVPVVMPAFHDADQHGVTLKDLAGTPSLDVAVLAPNQGRKLATSAGQRTWKKTSAPVELTADDGAAETWFAVYLASDRWQKVTFSAEIPADAHLKLWLGHEPVSLSTGDDGAHTADLELPIGVHTLILRAVVAAEMAETWELAPQLALADETPASALEITTERRLITDIDRVLDAPRAQQVSISPDGELVAVQLSARPAGGDSQSWIEIRDADSGELVTTWRGSRARRLDWSPDGHLTFVLPGDGEASDLWRFDVESGATERILRNIEHMGGYEWAPSGEFVIYAVQVEAEPDKRKVKRVKNPGDRQPWDRNRSYLVQAAVPEGHTRRLTAGPLSPGTWSISPDSRRLLFFLSEQDLAGGRPFYSSRLFELDLTTLEATQLLDDRWISGADYGPDDQTLLLQGSPSAFDGLGRNLPDGVQANDYGGQLYLYDRKRDEATPISKTLVPDVAGAWWSLDDGLVYAICTDTQFRNVYRCDPDQQDWQRVDTGVKYTDQFGLARQGRRAVARGTGATTPSKVFAVDLRKNEPELLDDPGRDDWQDVEFGDVTYWKAPLPDGELLDGRIYWPVDYDPGRTYPVIVYYYGGTSPVTVDFGGRYPKNVWAGQGYIVYVPEPSGATGYGQEFAARHVNDWGKRTAWEVIEATKAFVAAHPSADGERMGCIGASYGGFLTEYITTQTDLFAAAVSHAGISSISSYWGEGLWGYVYGARALANAYPWDNVDLYVQQSALFHADKINTPLLLVHGDSDTNVPVGESDQLFTALKVLGREVEYVQIQGQDHWVVDHGQRIVWNDTILAFFARHLKGRPGWWDALYAD